MTRQYALSLTLRPVYAEENFIVADGNRQAYDWVMRWPGWPCHALLIHGESGCGKTHLGRVWAARSRAIAWEGAPGGPPDCPALVENIERLNDEEALFHALNRAQGNRQSLLLTSAAPAAALPFRLPDLMSRLKALPSAEIVAPDDGLLAAMLRKQFADRQLKVADEVIEYLVPRMERSFSAARALAERLDAQALSEQRTLSVPFVRARMQG